MGLRSPGLMLSAVLLILWSGCSTTTHGVAGSQATADWIKQNQSRVCSITFKQGLHTKPIKGRLWMPDPTSPPSLSPETRILLVSGGDEQEISLGMVRTMEVVNGPRGVPDGALIGAGIGALTGAAVGYSAARAVHGEGAPTEGGQVMVAGIVSLIFSMFGSMFGAAVGGGVGHRDILVF
jgi:hypothetical protein